MYSIVKKKNNDRPHDTPIKIEFVYRICLEKCLENLFRKMFRKMLKNEGIGKVGTKTRTYFQKQDNFLTICKKCVYFDTKAFFIFDTNGLVIYNNDDSKGVCLRKEKKNNGNFELASTVRTQKPLCGKNSIWFEEIYDKELKEN